MMNDRRPMDAWMKFYIYWRFPLSFALNVFLGIAMIRNISLPVNRLIILALSAVCVLQGFVYVNMKKENIRGYRLNRILLLAEAVLFGLTKWNESGLFGFLYGAGSLALLWSLPNSFYFTNRRERFTARRDDWLDGP